MCDDTHLQYFPLTWEYLVSLLDPNRICDSFVHICISVHVNHISCWVEHICAYLCWHQPSTSSPRPSTFLSPTWEYRAHTIWVSFRHQSTNSSELNENFRSKKTLSVLHMYTTGDKRQCLELLEKGRMVNWPPNQHYWILNKLNVTEFFKSYW